MITVSITDTISSDLRDKYRAINNKAGIHSAISLGLASIAKRAFTDPSLRPTPWPARRDGSAATLRLSGTLAKSIRSSSSSEYAMVTSDRLYAAIHQLGGRTAPHTIRPRNKKALKTPYGLFKTVNHPGSVIPARPFLPFYRDGKPTKKAIELINQVLKKTLRIPG